MKGNLNMKYYSENLDKLFDTEEALKQAEAAIENKEQEKQRRTGELDAARNAVKEAQKKYVTLLTQYYKDYAQCSYPASCGDIGKSTLAEILNQIGFKLL